MVRSKMIIDTFWKKFQQNISEVMKMNVSIFKHIIFRMCRFFDTLFGNVSIFRQAQTYIRENNIEENIFNRRVRARELQIKSKVFSYSSETYFQLCVSNINYIPRSFNYINRDNNLNILRQSKTVYILRGS